MAEISITGDVVAFESDADVKAKVQSALEALVTKTSGDVKTVTVDSTKVTMADMAISLAKGYAVEGAPTWIKMTLKVYAGDVPVGIGNRSTFDDKGAESVRTWADWHDEYHKHQDASDGDKLVAGNSFGVELTSDELKVLISSKYTLLLAHEIRQYQVQQSPVDGVVVQ